MNTPTATAYFNGEFLPLNEVHISPLDRGFLFADGIYEVIPVYNGRFLRLDEHLNRLDNGLNALRIDANLSRNDWVHLLQQLVIRNGNGQLAVYLQVTRGAPSIRDHSFPQTETQTTVFAMANPLKTNIKLRAGWSAVTLEDIRWGACHIKSVALLANVLARQQALDRGADDAILVRDGILTECAAGNVYVIRDGLIRTPVKDQRILPGITRDLLLELAAANDIPYREEDIPVAALKSADEVWVTSSTKEIVPFIRIDGRPVGQGEPGQIWRRMYALYQAYKNDVCPPSTS